MHHVKLDIRCQQRRSHLKLRILSTLLTKWINLSSYLFSIHRVNRATSGDFAYAHKVIGISDGDTMIPLIDSKTGQNPTSEYWCAGKKSHSAKNPSESLFRDLLKGWPMCHRPQIDTASKLSLLCFATVSRPIKNKFGRNGFGLS